MARKYKKLRYADRKSIEEMCRERKSVTQMADATGVSHDTIYNKFRRSGTHRGGTRQET